MAPEGAEAAAVHLCGFLCARAPPARAMPLPAASSRRRLPAQGRRLLGTQHASTQLREVVLPPGWAGLSFRYEGERLLVTDVPKACFSSAAFSALALPQVSGVSKGDEILRINGEAPAALAARIASPGDELNTCSRASPPHAPGSVGKLDPSPCVSCDLLRRRKQLGLDAALLLWIRAVKPDGRQIVFSVMPQSQLQPASSMASDCLAPRAADSGGAAAPPVLAQGAVLPTASASPALPAAGGCAAKPTLSSEAAAAPPRSPNKRAASGVYNPLRPAAALASAAAAGPKAAAKALAQAFPKTSVAGFTVEERAPGCGPAQARKGQAAVLKYQLRLARDDRTIRRQGEPAVLERGEVSCCLGESEISDGWTDGCVDMEAVLGSWGCSVVGMRVGGKRRVHIPGRSSFKGDSGGEAVPVGAALFFDVELKKLE